MQLRYREIAVPVGVGTMLHIALVAIAWGFERALFPQGTDGTVSHWYVHASTWLHIAVALVPGFVCGFLASHRPMLYGGTAAFLGAAISSGIFYTWWFLPVSPEIFQVIAFGALQAIPFGVAAAATGFLVRGKGSDIACMDSSGNP
ncbi:MAG TPA: hypothetical protein PKZ76_02390 [Xanthomonadaceae bacterium]|nr:hypothetical protein [Xanthomonadaceae bacterium]